MFNDDFIEKNFLNPEETNYSLLIKKIEHFLKSFSENQSKYSPIRKCASNFFAEQLLQGNEIPYNPPENKCIKEDLLNIFQGTVRWHSPFSLINIIPSPLLDTVAATTITALYNPNALWDTLSGNIILYEKKVIKALCELVGWAFSDAEGLSTFGGKATLIYAIKIGLHKCDLSIIDHGIRDDYYVIASDRAHYSIEDACNFLGIGAKNLIRIETNAKGQMILEMLKDTVEQLLKKNKKIACIILNCGITIDMCVDPIHCIKMILTEIFSKWGRNQIPHIHADSVTGWAWLFFKNFEKHLFRKTDREIVDKLILMYRQVEEIKHSDSFSADFHKTGLTPNVSTFFVAKNHRDIFSLTKSGESSLKNLEQRGDFHIHHFTIENSRSSLGIVSAWITLQKLGYVGFQKYLVKLLQIGQECKKSILNYFKNDFILVNPNTLGFETLIKINFFGDTRSWVELNQSPSSEENRLYKIYSFKFKKFIYEKIFSDNKNVPLIGFVPMYRLQSSHVPLPCFLLYPMSLYSSDTDIKSFLKTLLNLRKEFEDTIDNSNQYDMKESLEKVPPR